MLRPSALEDILVKGGLTSKFARRFERFLDTDPKIGITGDALAQVLFCWAGDREGEYHLKALRTFKSLSQDHPDQLQMFLGDGR